MDHPHRPPPPIPSVGSAAPITMDEISAIRSEFDGRSARNDYSVVSDGAFRTHGGAHRGVSTFGSRIGAGADHDHQPQPSQLHRSSSAIAALAPPGEEHTVSLITESSHTIRESRPTRKLFATPVFAADHHPDGDLSSIAATPPGPSVAPSPLRPARPASAGGMVRDRAGLLPPPRTPQRAAVPSSLRVAPQLDREVGVSPNGPALLGSTHSQGTSEAPRADGLHLTHFEAAALARLQRDRDPSTAAQDTIRDTPASVMARSKSPVLSSRGPQSSVSRSKAFSFAASPLGSVTNASHREHIVSEHGDTHTHGDIAGSRHDYDTNVSADDGMRFLALAPPGAALGLGVQTGHALITAKPAAVLHPALAEAFDRRFSESVAALESAQIQEQQALFAAAQAEVRMTLLHEYEAHYRSEMKQQEQAIFDAISSATATILDLWVAQGCPTSAPANYTCREFRYLLDLTDATQITPGPLVQSAAENAAAPAPSLRSIKAKSMPLFMKRRSNTGSPGRHERRRAIPAPDVTPSRGAAEDIPRMALSPRYALDGGNQNGHLRSPLPERYADRFPTLYSTADRYLSHTPVGDVHSSPGSARSPVDSAPPLFEPEAGVTPQKAAAVRDAALMAVDPASPSATVHARLVAAAIRDQQQQQLEEAQGSYNPFVRESAAGETPETVEDDRVQDFHGDGAADPPLRGSALFSEGSLERYVPRGSQGSLTSPKPHHPRGPGGTLIALDAPAPSPQQTKSHGAVASPLGLSGGSGAFSKSEAPFPHHPVQNDGPSDWGVVDRYGAVHRGSIAWGPGGPGAHIDDPHAAHSDGGFGDGVVSRPITTMVQRVRQSSRSASQDHGDAFSGPMSLLRYRRTDAGNAGPSSSRAVSYDPGTAAVPTSVGLATPQKTTARAKDDVAAGLGMELQERSDTFVEMLLRGAPMPAVSAGASSRARAAHGVRHAGPSRPAPIRQLSLEVRKTADATSPQFTGGRKPSPKHRTAEGIEQTTSADWGAVPRVTSAPVPEPPKTAPPAHQLPPATPPQAPVETSEKETIHQPPPPVMADPASSSASSASGVKFSPVQGKVGFVAKAAAEMERKRSEQAAAPNPRPGAASEGKLPSGDPVPAPPNEVQPSAQAPTPREVEEAAFQAMMARTPRSRKTVFDASSSPGGTSSSVSSLSLGETP